MLTGEISDELFGYKYTDFAPSPEAFQQEAKKRVDELYMYDVLRADRCIAVNSIEARVPFGDLDFVKYVMSIDPKLKVNSYHMGKYLLREAFAADRILPEDILWRQKAAFSDAVGHSMVDDLKEYAESLYTDEEYEEKRKQYSFAHAVHEGKPALPRAVREVLPRAGRDGQGLLDAEQGLGGLRRQGPLRPRALQLRRKRRVSYTESTGRGRPAGRSLFI